MMEGRERSVRIGVPEGILEGDLVVPERAVGLVVFAHGSGSSRKSSRNRFVAGSLQEGGLATLLLDLLTMDEDRVDQRTREYRFDIPRLARRLVAAIDWIALDRALGAIPIGTFGASTGAAAAVIAAAERPDRVAAVVSRGGRPDLAGAALERIAVPSLFIVGGDDTAVIQLNRDAMAQMAAPTRLAIVPGATHLFEEPGTLEQVAELARAFFLEHLPSTPVVRSRRKPDALRARAPGGAQAHRRARAAPARFADRLDAGRRLADLLGRFRGRQTIVLGLPRGGVPVAAEIARALGAPLDVWVVRKIGAPNQPELGIGAIAEGGEPWIDTRTAGLTGASADDVQRAVDRETIELNRRVERFREGRARPALAGKTVIVVDDGIATGSTVRAALAAIGKLKPARIVLAVPVAAIDSLEALRPLADEIVCLEPSANLISVGRWYDQFRQTEDDEVIRLLGELRAAPRQGATGRP